MRKLLRRSLWSTLFVLAATFSLVQTEAAPREKVLDRAALVAPAISSVSQGGFNLQMIPISFERLLVIRVDGSVAIIEYDWVRDDSGAISTDGLHDDNDPWFGDRKEADKQEDDSNNPDEHNEEGPLDGILHDLSQGGTTASDDEQP